MQQLKMEEVLLSLDEINKKGGQTLTVERRAAVDLHKCKTHVRSYNPTKGYYVFVARMNGTRTKVSANWAGPRRVGNILSDDNVEVEHLLSSKRERFHVRRIKHYFDADVGAMVAMEKIAEVSGRK